jgi:nucleoside-diphosphate-sugar epimerase
MQNQNILNDMVVPDSKVRSLRILVTGASGFIGSRVVYRLSLSS